MKSIIHSLIRLWLKIASSFFFDKIKVSGTENLPLGCPVIFACNHPNAFLDSIVMTTCAKRPLYYTARGDFFKPKLANSLLRFINILPVYRMEEGREHMYKNDETFADCIKLFKKNGAVTIFVEGLSENKWELRSLRKGTARLAFEAWNNPGIGDKLKIVPVAIHYSSWLKLHPVVYVEFLKNIDKKDFPDISENGVFNKKFNEQLRAILLSRCITVDQSGDTVSQNKIIGFILKNYLHGNLNAKKLQDKYLSTVDQQFKSNYKTLSDYLIKENINYNLKPETGIMRIINLVSWFIVIAAAIVYNFIPYYFCSLIVRKSTEGNDFHDSVLYCILLVIYPIYLITLFYVTTRYINLGSGLLVAFLAAYSAYFYEASKRYIVTSFQRSKLVTVQDMLKRLYEINNG